MNSPWLGEYLSTPLLEFASSPNTECPNNLDNLKHPNELDVTFLETLSDSDIQLLDKYSDDTNESLNTTSTRRVASASDVWCPNHTSSASVFAVTTEDDLKRLKDKNKNHC